MVFRGGFELQVNFFRHGAAGGKNKRNVRRWIKTRHRQKGVFSVQEHGVVRQSNIFQEVKYIGGHRIVSVNLSESTSEGDYYNCLFSFTFLLSEGVEL